MSYNIDSVEYIKGKLYISRDVAISLRSLYSGELPEANLFEDLDIDESEDEVLEIVRPSWDGTASGWSYDIFKKILEKTTGNADLRLVWEGGDSITGLRVEEGTVTEKLVKQELE